MITLDFAQLPQALREIHDPPQKLYLMGNQELLSAELLITVVGSRRFTSYGKQALELIIPPLVRAGAVIISGLAFGVDAYSHEVALRENGKCIAVLGSGVDVISPRTNIPLSKRILEAGGAIISEYEPGTDAHPYHFPARNRIMTGLSKATIVIEAREKSGSLISARFAMEQNREVFAVPGSIFQENQKGTNWLISQGAHPVLDASSILVALGLVEAQQTLALAFESPEEKMIFECLQEPRSLDEVVQETKLPLGTASQTLSMLELKGMIKDYGGRRFGKVS